METQPTITTQNTTLAVIGDDDPFTAYANAMAPRNIVGTLLRFSKGDYLAGEEGAAVPGGTMMTANVGELLVGWVLWADNKPTQQIMFRVADGKPVPKRSELGHTDQERWEVDSHGEKRDPWQFTNYLPLLAERAVSCSRSRRHRAAASVPSASYAGVTVNTASTTLTCCR